MKPNFHYFHFLQRRGMLLAVSMLCFSAVQAGQLTQQDYDQQLQRYMDVINQSKTVLDDPASTADAEAKSLSFCQRIHAYRQIAQISKDNLNLDMASIMLMASQNFLERQQKSLSASGMTSEFMCAVKEQPASAQPE